MKAKYYWKVVRLDKGKYVSAMMYSDIHEQYCLKYIIGEYLSPEKGKIFLFKTRAQARYFKKSLDTRRGGLFGILKVKIIGDPQEITCRKPTYCTKKDFDIFWNRYETESGFKYFSPHLPIGFYSTPIGTVGADKIYIVSEE